MSGPRLLFGIGATKAGTSWLHHWLRGHSEVGLRSVKELHYFDALSRDRMARRIEELATERDDLMSGRAGSERLQDIDDLIGLFSTPSDAAYLDYLGRERAVVGDITPAYGLLPEADLRRMDSLGEARFLLILRDPVARLWSHVRMIAGRREPDGAVTDARSGRILSRTLSGHEAEIESRSDYRGMFDRLCHAVPGPRRLVVFFEDLFSGDATKMICAFLGISPAPPLSKVVHAGQPLPMSAAQARAARDWLAPQYDYITRAMGRVPPAWTERV
ncbi:MAG: sulfotransferase [Pseudomonadota bacterium]